MSISEQDIRKIVQGGENDTVEFKTSIRDASILVQNITAFANAHGGTIVVGIQEPHNIVGADSEQIIKIVERAKPMFVPSLDLGVSTIEIDNKNVVVITVPESKETVFGNGMALKRVGDRNQPLSADEITRKVHTPASSEDIRRLADAVSKQTEINAELNRKLDKANSLPLKLLTGAGWVVFGVLLKILLEWLWRLVVAFKT